MGKLSSLLSALLISASILGSTLAQRSKSCDVQRSLTDNKKVNVHCDCLQRLNQMSVSVAQLTINKTGCSETEYELSWFQLETLVAPEILMVEGSQVFFAQKASNKPWKSSIKRLDFVDSEIRELPANAFQGITLLEEVSFMGSTIENIKSDAFSGLHQLKLVEIANSTVITIEDHAFNNLPALEELSIVYSSVGSIETGAVTLLQPQDTLRQRCPGIGRSMDTPKEMLGGIMGRELTSIGNLSLPEYGTRLLLFKNNIFTMSSKAITSETLSFLVVGGNDIITVEDEAFNMELDNECAISAALFVGNTIGELGSWAFRDLKGRDGVSYQAFIALANNTFQTASDQSFQLSDNLVVFEVEQNQFTCECKNFGWLLKNSSSQIQRELEKEIVQKATCLDGAHLKSFASSCTNHGRTSDVIPTESAIKATSHDTSSLLPDVTTSLPSNSASTITYTTSILIFVLCSLML